MNPQHGNAAERAEPLITIAMPIYNAGNDLRLAVRSLLVQTERNWELLLIDDGSTDQSIEEIGDLIRDSRIRLVRGDKNKGLAKRLNEAIDMARGEFLARMDHDDVSFPERLEKQVIALRKDESLDVVATRAILIDENYQEAGMFPSEILHRDICKYPWRGFYFPHPAWMGRTEWFRKFRYREQGTYLCEDQELLLRSYPKSKFETVNQVLFAYRIRTHVSLRKKWKTHLSWLGVQLRQFLLRKQPGYILLSMLVFGARMFRDLLRAFLFQLQLKQRFKKAGAQSELWKSVLKKLNYPGQQ